jgi:hypothetical protein
MVYLEVEKHPEETRVLNLANTKANGDQPEP